MTKLRAFSILLVFVVVTVILLPLQWAAVKLHIPARRSIPYRYHRFVCRLFGVRVSVLGAPLRGGGLMTANHTGWLDIPILSAVAPVSFVAKIEVAQWPFFGTLARLQRTIFIRRERAKALEDRDTIRKRLLEGDALVLFPEGTSSDGNRVLPFRSALVGAVKEAGARAGGILLQPMSICYTGLNGIPMGRQHRPTVAWYGDLDFMPHIRALIGRGAVDAVVSYGDPVAADGTTDRKAMAKSLEGAVRAITVATLRGRPQLPLRTKTS